MRDGSRYAQRAGLIECRRRPHECLARRAQIIDQDHVPALGLTYDLVSRRQMPRGTPLFNEQEFDGLAEPPFEVLTKRLRPFDAPDVR
jgi:hypothetical protein